MLLYFWPVFPVALLSTAFDKTDCLGATALSVYSIFCLITDGCKKQLDIHHLPTSYTTVETAPPNALEVVNMFAWISTAD